MARTTKAQREASIQNIFADVGAEYRYKNVSVRLTTRKNFSVKWQRSFDWISFDISDFIEYASAEVIRELAHTLFAHIVTGERRPYGQEFKDYIMSKDFIAKMQPRFIKRNSATADDRLNDIVAGLDAPEGTVFAVVDNSSLDWIAYSVVFRAVLVPAYILIDLDADEVRDIIADELTKLAHAIEHFGEVNE